ncbi:MAG: hypothetical protein QOH21_2038, partial [Acidobacteriota bacterium]|jgi:hypothetical protein|nr:hypothetical protein [Acidobacteriota bacterium]
MVVILILAATLLWRVYNHHNNMKRYLDEPLQVRLDVAEQPPVTFSSDWR